MTTALPNQENGSPSRPTSEPSQTLDPYNAMNDAGKSLLTFLLEDQQNLTAVDQFSKSVECRAVVCEPVPAQAKYYKSLLPATKPGPGQQYAFEVDLDNCSGCKSCVTACHSLNGLDDEETWRDVGLLVGGTANNPIMQHVTTACHHCLEPACMIACPVNAYEKNPVTGIVKHLDDQCFGCQYCTLACPYDVPKYHSEKGIVRKCDMCSDRLASDEAPACVQACPHEAIAIKVVDVEEVIENSEVDQFLPAAPDPYITQPTTTYKSKNAFPRNTLPADYYSVSPQHPHWPLIVMLVLTQLSVGAFVVAMGMEHFLGGELLETIRPFQSVFGLAFGLLALAASTMHLGRPQYAFRAILGIKHSWLSREIVAFGAFAGLASLYTGICWSGDVVDSQWVSWLRMSVTSVGLAAIFSSIMIYVFTRREFWRFGICTAKFYGTAAVLGLTATWFSLWLYAAIYESDQVDRLLTTSGRTLISAIMITSLVKLTFEASFFLHLIEHRNSALKRSALLMTGQLANATIARFALGALGGLAMPLFLLSQLGSEQVNNLVLGVVATIMFVACLVGEMLERYLFFAAAAAPRMPGGVRQ